MNYYVASIILIAILLFPVSAVAQLTDDYYSLQGYLHSIQLNPERQTKFGEGIVVAIIDDGVWHGHPDLQNRMWVNQREILGNRYDDDNNGYTDDYYGWNFIDNTADMNTKGSHGTSVAGIIAAQRNGTGIIGIAPSVKIMSLIACDKYGCPTAVVTKAIKYAADNGANIINLSLASTNGYVGYTKDYDWYIDYAYKKNVVIIAAAGNGDLESKNYAAQIGFNLSLTPVSPVCNDVDGYNKVLGVGAAGSAWSNYGNCVDILAPGESIVTTTVPANTGGAGYEYVHGTSFSSPMVAGTAALIMERFPGIRNFEVINRIISFPLNEIHNKNLSITNALGGNLTFPTLSSVSKTEVSSGDIIEVKGNNFSSNRRLSLVGPTGSLVISSPEYNDASSLNVMIPFNLESGDYYFIFQNVDSKSPVFRVVGSNTIQNNILQSNNITSGDASETPANSYFNPAKRDSGLISRLKGYILLQTEERGEAWYLNPADDKRYYMKDGPTAYEMMRRFGLGITNADLQKIPVGLETRFQDVDTDGDGLPDKLEEGLGTDPLKADTDGDGVIDGDEVLKYHTNPLGGGKLTYSTALTNKLKGKLLLQVESRGEAWYVHPVDGKRYYMKDGAAAYQIMRFLSLGITNANLQKLPDGNL